MKKVVRANAADCEELAEFLNTVFTEQNGCQEDFKGMYPRIFKPEKKMMNSHYIIRENGKICACAASYPMNYNVCGNTIKAAAGGNVAVASSMRGQGLMSTVLNEIELCERKEGFDLSYLHGDRKRYRFYGYERCGIEYRFQISRGLLKEEENTNIIVFKELNIEDKKTVGQLLAIQKKQSDFLIRDHVEFVEGLLAKSRTLFVVFIDNVMVGFLAANEERTVLTDLSLTDRKMFRSVVKSFAETFDSRIIVISLPEYSPYVREAYPISDRYTVFQPGNFRIYNFKKVVETFMHAKLSYSNLLDGVLTIDSTVHGKWHIKKSKEIVEVNPFEGDAKIKLEGYSVYPFLFGTAPFYDKNIDDETTKIISSWLPLPLYCPYLS